MARTSPGGVSNSGAKQFSNCQGRITLDNYNRVVASSNYTNHAKKLPINKYPYLHPLSVNEVVINSPFYN